MRMMKNYVTILCSAAFCFSLAVTGCKGKKKDGIPDGYYEIADGGFVGCKRCVTPFVKNTLSYWSYLPSISLTT